MGFTRAKVSAFLTVPRLAVISFATAIGIGTLALYIANELGDASKHATPIDTLFTVASAICVTGLTVRDTGNDFTIFGQVVILVLIQIGGLGILTFTNVVMFLQTGRMTLQQRQLVHQRIGESPSISASSLLLRVVVYALAIETAGAIALTACFARTYPLPYALWLGTFHSVSAFCNAGFGLFSDSLEQVRGDVIINVIIMSLIVLGGLGFLVLSDIGGWIRAARTRVRRRLLYQTRVVLYTSGTLVLLGAAAILFLESTGSASTGSLGQRVLDSVFLSVTARTAGFNTIGTQYLTNSTLVIVILLMAIGGSPGSTAGGMKTTVVATMFAVLGSRARNRPKVELLSRSIPEETVTKAMLTLTAFVLTAVAATFALQITELSGPERYLQRGEFLEYLFEVVSALCTVGLSTGVTRDLTSIGKCVIIACMFVGRLGPLIIAASFVGTRRSPEMTYPEDNLTIG